MKRPAFHFILPVLAFLAVPFAYNSCQGGLFGSKGFTAAKSNCKSTAGLYKGQLAKLSDLADPSPFAQAKVLLHPKDNPALGAQSKASAPITVKANESLSVIVDNRCLQDRRDELTSTVLSKFAAESDQGKLDLPEQAYAWSPEREMSESEINDIANSDPCVRGVSFNQKYEISGFSDNGFFYQTHLPAIHAEEAYPYFYNSTGGMDQSTGNAVIVAVIDTGVDWQHPDLSNNLLRHAYGIGKDVTATQGSANEFNPMDVSEIGHGTHVAGMIGAVTNNNMGIVGAMPWRVKIMPLKIFAVDGGGNLSTTSQYFFNAVKWAINNGAHVLNLSLGNITNSPNTDAVVEDAVNQAITAGVTVVTVTGNASGGSNGGEINGQTLTVLPGMYSVKQGVIGVGSFDASTGNKSYFSHYSKTYGEVAAPGADNQTTGVYSTLPLALQSYGRLSGTSQAAPLVSAAAALTIGIIRDAYNYVPAPAEVENLILAGSVKDTAKLGPYFKDGNRLDLLKLVQTINARYPNTRNSGSGSMDLSSLSCPQ